MDERFSSRIRFNYDELRDFQRMHANALALRFGEIAATMLAAYASGRSAKQVAYATDGSEHTVRTHIKKAYKRLGINDKAHLAITLLRAPRP